MHSGLSQGDADTWSGYCRRLMVSVHQVLDLALMGLEPPAAEPKYRDMLAPPDRQQPASLLGDVALPGKSLQPALRLLAALLECLQQVGGVLSLCSFVFCWFAVYCAAVVYVAGTVVTRNAADTAYAVHRAAFLHPCKLFGPLVWDEISVDLVSSSRLMDL